MSKTTNPPKKPILLASVGTILEWAEYTFYGYMAIPLAGIFFPSGHPTLNLVKIFGVFAAGYLMRPLGAILFGSLGDKIGRRFALMLSMLLMGFATLGIGLLPSYASIGALAPILLLILRLIQGIAVSGEYNGAAIYMIEQSSKRPYFYGSLIPACAAMGMALGGLASFIVNLDIMPDWAYRVPFLLGGLSCFIALGFRTKMNDSVEFTKAKVSQAPVPLKKIITTYKTSFLRVGMIAAITGIYVYIGNVYFVTFLKNQVGLSLAKATMIAFLGQLLVAIGIPFIGSLSDKIKDPHSFYGKGLFAAGIVMPVMYQLSATGQLGLIILSVCLYAGANIWMSGPMMKIVQDEFPTLIRYRGTAISWSVFVAIFGGSSLNIAQAMGEHFKAPFACGLYVSFFALLTWLVLNFVKPHEKRRTTQSTMAFSHKKAIS